MAIRVEYKDGMSPLERLELLAGRTADSDIRGEMYFIIDDLKAEQARRWYMAWDLVNDQAIAIIDANETTTDYEMQVSIAKRYEEPVDNGTRVELIELDEMDRMSITTHPDTPAERQHCCECTRPPNSPYHQRGHRVFDHEFNPARPVDELT